MKGILYLMFLLVCVKSAIAQTTIKGKVSDTKGEPLIGVNISIKSSYDGATTNVNGEYSFETTAKDSIILTATYIGYVPQEKKILLNAKNMTINFSIKEKINDLKAVVISAGSFEASDEKKGTVLKALDIVTTAGSNGDSYGALKTLPGAQQTNDREGLFVRGGTGAETQTFIDGTWVRNAFSASIPDLGARGRFNPFIFKGTVFSTGGYSALYGQALSSAVILESIDLPDRSSANLNLSSVGIGGSFQQLAKNKKSSYGIGYNYTNLTPYFLLVKQNIQYKTAPTVHQIDLNYRIKTSKTGIFKFYGYLNHTAIDIQRDNVSSFDYEEVSKQYQDRFGIKNKNAYANISYKEFFGKDWKVTAGACFSTNHDDILLKVLNDNGDITTDSNFKYREDISITNGNILASGKLVLEKSLNNLNTIRFGAEHIYNQEKTLYKYQPLVSIIDYVPKRLDENLTAVFAESDIYITNDIAGKIGVRGEYSALLNKMNVAPRVSAAYKFNKSGQLSVAYGMFYQKPELSYLFQNSNLNYMRADHYIVNYQYQPKDRILRLEAYYKNYFSLIKTNVAAAPSGIANTGNGYARGFEIFYRDKKSIKGIDFWISYSLLDTKRDFLNYVRKVQPDFAATHTANLVFKKFWVKRMFGINGTYTFSSGRPYINYNSTNLNNPELFMTDRTVAYHNLSISANYIKVVKKTYIVFVASVNNPFGFKQVYGYNYASKDLNNNGYLYSKAITPAAKQFFFLGMFMSFGIDRTQEAIDNNL